MIEHLHALRGDQRGATAVEYGLILATLALGIVAATGRVGVRVVGVFEEIVAAFAAAGIG